MKKLLILTLAVLSLTACQTKPAVENMMNYEDFEPKTAQEQLDADTLVTAVRTENKALCATIENQTQKDNCAIKVDDQKALKNAQAKLDKKACAIIKEAVTKTQCDLIVEDMLADIEVEKNSLKEQEDAQKFVDSKNLKGCKEINDVNFREQCEINIYYKMALDDLDPKHCENIDPKDLREACRAQIPE